MGLHRHAGGVAAALALAAAGAAVGQPLTPRGADNLTALARLGAVVRFFHPSDGVAGADWNAVNVAGVEAVEDAADAADLARRLGAWIAPLAPTVRVFPGGAPLPAAAELGQPPVDGARIVAWRHYGGKLDGHSKVLTSERVEAGVRPFATLVQAVEAGPLAGGRVRLTAALRADLGAGASLELGVRVDRRGGASTLAGRAPVRGSSWRPYSIAFDVPADAERLTVIVVLTGEGRAWIDDAALAAAGSPNAAPALANGGFEEGEPGKQPPGWLLPYESVKAGYHLQLADGDACRRGRCARLESDATVAWRPRPPADTRRLDLGAGVEADVALSLYADATGTLPHPVAAAPQAASPGDSDRRARSERLAAAITAWAIAAELHPFLDAQPSDWMASLRQALPDVAAARDRESARSAVACLLAAIPDERLEINDGAAPALRALPLDWAWIEDRWIVTATAPEAAGIRPGDEILAVDGEPAAALLARTLRCTAGATLDGRRWRALARLAAGPAEGARRLRVAHLEGGELEATLPFTRDPLAPSPLGGGEAVREVGAGTLYVDLRRLTEDALPELLRRARAARSLVFDLRGQTDMGTILLSHLLEHPAQSPSWQLPILTAPDGADRAWLTTFWTIPARAPRLDADVAVLIDARAWAYTESLLAMFEHERRGLLVGAASAGSNGVMNAAALPGGFGMVWTTSRVLKHDGSPFQGVGVRPTHPAAATRAGVAAGRDEVLERAVAALAQRAPGEH